MGIRRKARELALQALYQGEMNGEAPEKTLALLCEHFVINKKAVPYARELVSGVSERWDELNTLIQRNAANWRLSRMSVIDRNIIRLATFELCCKEDVPPTVVINEAIEVAKRFSSDESSAFINGILDAIKKGMTK